MAVRVFVNQLSDNDMFILNIYINEGIDYQKIRTRQLVRVSE